MSCSNLCRTKARTLLAQAELTIEIFSKTFNRVAANGTVLCHSEALRKCLQPVPASRAVIIGECDKRACRAVASSVLRCRRPWWLCFSKVSLQAAAEGPRLHPNQSRHYR